MNNNDFWKEPNVPEVTIYFWIKIIFWDTQFYTQKFSRYKGVIFSLAEHNS